MKTELIKKISEQLSRNIDCDKCICFDICNEHTGTCEETINDYLTEVFGGD